MSRILALTMTRNAISIPILPIVAFSVLATHISQALAIEKWEVPIIYEYLVCDGPVASGCEHFVGSEFGSAAGAFQLLAERGNAAAQNNLGVLYESGAGVPENDSEALRLYRQSAESGLPMAQHNLAVLLAADYILGTAKNPENRSAHFIEAYVLFALAASKGLEVASRGLSDLVKYMSKEEIVEGQAMLEKACKDSPLR